MHQQYQNRSPDNKDENDAPAPKSDVQIADAIAQRHSKAKYSEGKFWEYRGNHWQAIRLSNLRQEVMTYDSPEVRLGRGRIDSIIACLEDLLHAPNFFTQRVIGINCANGFITFEPDGEPRITDHAPEHRQRHVLPGHWKPDTESDPPKGSLLATLLGGSFLDDPEGVEKIGLLQEIAGVIVLGYSRHLTSPKAAIFLGRSAENGKNQFMNAYAGLLPKSAVAAIPPERFHDDNKLSLLTGALLNISGELSSGAIASERFKGVITGDLIDVRKAYDRNVVLFRPEAQHVYGANQLPQFKGGMDAGVRRRLMVVEFLRIIPEEERIQDIGKKIAEQEADLLLAWAVEGARRILKHGHFSALESSSRALAEWVQSADPVLGWIEDRVVSAQLAVVGEPPPRVSSHEAFADFRVWHLANEGQPTRLTQRTFTERLKGSDLGLRYIPGSNGFRGFEGLRLKSPTERMKRVSEELIRVGKL